MIVALAGGVGAARMLRGILAVVPPEQVTAIVNTMQALFAQQPVGSDIWTALAWLAATLVAAYTFAIVIYRRRIS